MLSVSRRCYARRKLPGCCNRRRHRLPHGRGSVTLSKYSAYGDGEITSLSESMFLSVRSVSPVMREQRLMNTPMAIEGISKRRGISKDELIRERDACAG